MYFSGKVSVMERTVIKQHSTFTIQLASSLVYKRLFPNCCKGSSYKNPKQEFYDLIV